MTSAKIAGMRFLVHRFMDESYGMARLSLTVIQESAGQAIREGFFWVLFFKEKYIVGQGETKCLKELDPRIREDDVRKYLI